MDRNKVNEVKDRSVESSCAEDKTQEVIEDVAQNNPITKQCCLSLSEIREIEKTLAANKRVKENYEHSFVSKRKCLLQIVEEYKRSK